MYQSDFFYINEANVKNNFNPIVTSVYKIFADGTYYHFCDENEKQNHLMQTIAFIRCTHGEGKIYFNNTSIILAENDCVFIPFHSIKKYKSHSNIWEYKWINFLADNPGTEFEFNKIYHISFSDNESKAFEKLISFGKSDIKNNNYLNSLFLSYFYSIMIESRMNKNDAQINPSNEIIDEMCSYINQKIYSKISVEEISAFFKISPRRLHQIFTSQLNISPKKYIIKKKMEESYRLIVQTSTPINQIADMLCFSSPYHFSNKFKETFNHSPSDLRKKDTN